MNRTSQRIRIRLIVLALLGFAVLELWVLVQVAQQLGPWITVGLVLLTSLIGVFALQREGTRTWRALSEAVQTGRVPAKEALDAVLVVLGAILLLLPGFVTDVVGLLLVARPTRPLAGALVAGLVWGSRRRSPGSAGPGGASGEVIEGEIIDPDELR